jgi:hypothetical protein
VLAIDLLALWTLQIFEEMSQQNRESVSEMRRFAMG